VWQDFDEPDGTSETTDAPVNDIVRVHFMHNSGGKHLLNGTIPITIA
jgi:hypothetical protein